MYDAGDTRTCGGSLPFSPTDTFACFVGSTFTYGTCLGVVAAGGAAASALTRAERRVGIAVDGSGAVCAGL